MSSDNIHVAIRIRPFLDKEEDRNQWQVQDNQIFQIDEHGQRINEIYSFDHIFHMQKTNTEIYNDIVKSFIEQCMGGLNATIFAYGQTSSGKTYTMLGDDNNRGIMSMAVDDIFEHIRIVNNKKFLLRVSYIEIYNEKINDLLNPTRKDLRIRVNIDGAVSVSDVIEEFVTTKQEVFAILERGNLNRQVGETCMNERSSRSHTIFRISIESVMDDSVTVSELNLVDLAGSERVAQTKATNIRFREGVTINKSLSALGLVIKQLSDGQEFVSFRDSKLTHLLKQALGGNAKTLFIATITLAYIDDTHSTLSFAQRAKYIKNKPKVIQIISESEKENRYTKLNLELQQKLNDELAKNQELEKIKNNNTREIMRLQEQLQMVEFFQHGKPKSDVCPKRRHTIGYAERKPYMHAIAEEDTDCTVLSSYETPIKAPPVLDVVLSPPTPQSVLRKRISLLEESYNELVTYTRDEKNIIKEHEQIIEELKQKLSDAERALSESRKQSLAEEEILTMQLKNNFKRREDELISHIHELKNQLESESNNTKGETDHNYDTVDTQYISEQLISLENILKSDEYWQSADTSTHDSDIVDSFNTKKSASENLIKEEILKQVKIFSTEKLNESLTLPSEIDIFSNLLQEFSELGGQKHDIENLEFLMQVYESLVIKNKLIGTCMQGKVKSDLNEITEIENLKKDLILKTEAFDKLEIEKKRIEEMCNKYKERLDRLEHSMESFNLASYQGTKKRNAALEEQLEDYKKQLDDANTKIQKQAKENETLSKSNESLKAILDEQLSEKGYIEKILLLQESCEHYKSCIQSTESEMRLLQEKFSNLRIQLDNYKEVYGDLENYKYYKPRRRSTCSKNTSLSTPTNGSMIEYREIENGSNKENRQSHNNSIPILGVSSHGLELESLMSKIKILEGDKCALEVLHNDLLGDCKAKQQKIDNLQLSLLDYKDKLAESRKLSQTLKSDLSDLKVLHEKCDTQNKDAEISELTAKIEQQNRIIDEYIDKIKQLEDEKLGEPEITALQEAKLDLSEQIEICKMDYKYLKEECDELKKQNEGLSSDNLTMKERISSLENIVSQVKEAEKMNRSLKEQIDNNNKNIISLENDVQQFRKRMSEIENIGNKAEARLQDNLKLIADLKAELMTKSNTIKSLENNNNKLNDQISDLDRYKSDYNAAQKIIDKNTKTIDNLKMQIFNQDGKIKDLEDENRNLQEQISNLQEVKNDYEAVKLEVAAKLKIIDNLRVHIASKDNNIANLENVIEKLRNEISSHHKSAAQNRESASQLQDLVLQKENLMKESAELKKRLGLLQPLLTKIMQQIMANVKTLTTSKHCQEHRDYLKNAKKELKEFHVELKKQIQCVEDNAYNLEDVFAVMSNVFTAFIQYDLLERKFLQSIIDKTEASNSEYLQIINSLKAVQESKKPLECKQCELMQNEINQLQLTVKSGETKLVETLRKLRDLEEKLLTGSSSTFPCSNCRNLTKQNQQLSEEIFELKIKLYEKDDTSVLMQSEDLLEYYRDEYLKQKKLLEKYENTSLAQSNTAEIQCDIITYDNYQKLKSLAIIRKDEIVRLKAQNLKSGQTDDCPNAKMLKFYQEEYPKLEASVKTHETKENKAYYTSEVQCDILSYSRYQQLKYVAQTRKDEIKRLRALLEAEQSCLSKVSNN